MPRYLLLGCAFLTLSAQAQRKPVTIDAITAERKITGFEPIQWAPDSQRFAWLEEKHLWVYDVPSGQRKLLADLSDLEAKAVTASSPACFSVAGQQRHRADFFMV